METVHYAAVQQLKPDAMSRAFNDRNIILSFSMFSDHYSSLNHYHYSFKSPLLPTYLHHLFILLPSHRLWNLISSSLGFCWEGSKGKSYICKWQGGLPTSYGYGPVSKENKYNQMSISPCSAGTEIAHFSKLYITLIYILVYIYTNILVYIYTNILVYIFPFLLFKLSHILHTRSLMCCNL